MKNLAKVLFVAVLMLTTTTTFAQKFGRVDLGSIITSMPESKEAQTNLEAYGKDLQDQLEQILVEYNTLYAEYEKNAATLSDSVRQLKERELMELQQRYTDFQQIAQQDMQKKQAEVLQPIYQKAQEAINKIAKLAGYLVVFNTEGNMPASAGLAYFDEAALTDITADVKKELGIVDAPAQ